MHNLIKSKRLNLKKKKKFISKAKRNRRTNKKIKNILNENDNIESISAIEKMRQRKPR